MKKIAGITIITMCLAGSVLLTACNVSGSNTIVSTAVTTIETEESTTETLATTETAAITETSVETTSKPSTTPTETPTTTTTAAPTAEPTTVATTTAKPTPKPTAKPTTPTQTTAATTKATEPAPTTTAAPTETTTAPPKYHENPDAIRDSIKQYCIDKGIWYPEGEKAGTGEKSWSCGYYYSDQEYIDAFINGKILWDGELYCRVTTVSCWIDENDWLHIYFEYCAL